MKVYGEVDVQIHILSTSALAPRPCRFTAGERASGTHWIGGWVDPRAGLGDVEKGKLLILPGLKLRPLACPAGSQSLYWLRYGIKSLQFHLSLMLLVATEANITTVRLLWAQATITFGNATRGLMISLRKFWGRKYENWTWPAMDMVQGWWHLCDRCHQ
jgi:hypothetical protein